MIQKSPAVVCIALLWVGPLLAESLSENQSRFGVITGDVGLLAQGAVDWIAPHEGLPMEVGDHIRTGEDGHVELVLSDNAFWELEPLTDVVVEHTELNAGRLDLSKGSLMGRVDSARAAGTPQHWEFDAPAAVLTVTGTEFAIDAAKESETHFGIFEGTVDIQPAETADGPQPPVQVPAGREAFSPRGQPIQVQYHWSPRMKELFGRRAALRRRQKQIEDTWSPFTISVRANLRLKFVGPPPKPRPARPHINPRRRPAPDTPPS